MDAWEVVDQKTVDTVPTFTLRERDEMDIEEVYDATMSGLYVFEMKKVTNLRGAVVFAQQLLLQEAEAKGYNVFLTQGWKVTRLRKGKQERAEVRYWGRPASIPGKPAQPRGPPFLAMLDERVGI
ncbi:hypothetical protein L226DRAFT_564446 [Lentinus tigrinus ALCF2SS1-7]|uniref:Uncharacterized protein n=1 Tax=Lentinus tigrinus ALCF2SS1-6 TaxID=1328759 RepID=A0A5C2SJ36_9APHY|nr:hypothetical protein L227DRAFT_572999 [Lentinus tigrinus ALCF2SS1-6]RPD81784.1 hypothetical protein L226DRAFT_564446 [Lentinus tigrinus ALCF2SS1-7]